MTPSIPGHRLITCIAHGRYGDLWKAEFEGRTVALKLFPRTGSFDRSSLRRETFAQAALGDLPGPERKFFPRIERIEIDADPAWMRREWIEGTSLEETLQRPDLPLRRRLDLGQQILEALAIVHRRGFVHGDLSPSNALVESEQIRLIDVGFGALFDESPQDLVSSRTPEDTPPGVASPLYAAPERFRSDCGKPGDVFSFGKVLYRLITGETPLVIKPVSRRFQALGPEWDEFLFRCLEENPKNRFSDAAAALEEYRRIYRPQQAAGEYRVDCPNCRHVSQIPGGWAGERFACAGCRMTLEVLFYDEDGHDAATSVVTDRPDAGIEFLDEEDAEDARKFCPACGGRVDPRSKHCRHCETEVHEFARKYVEHRTAANPPRPPAGIPSFTGAAWRTALGYLCLWLPGALLNWKHLQEARKVARETGVEPPGMTALMFMMWSLVFMPAVLLFAGLMLVILAGGGGILLYG